MSSWAGPAFGFGLALEDDLLPPVDAPRTDAITDRLPIVAPRAFGRHVIEHPDRGASVHAFSRWPGLSVEAPLLALEPMAGEFERPAVLSHGAQELV